jgi:hypothetical protein
MSGFTKKLNIPDSPAACDNGDFTSLLRKIRK